MAPRKKDPDIQLWDECLNFIQKRMFKEKTTRSDVAIRIRENKDLQCTVVKTTWSTFCKPDARALPIDAILFELNKTVLEAYVLANLHVVRMCSSNQPVPKLDQSFFYGCLSAVSSSSRQKAIITDIKFRQTVTEYLSWRPDGYVPPDSSHLASGWHQDISLQMVTNTKNSTSTMFYKRFARYLKTKYMMDGSQAYATLKNILAKEYEGDSDLVKRYRAKLPKSPNTSGVEEYPHLVMPLQYEFLEYFEHTQSLKAQESDRESRLFSLIPTKAGFECNHFKMCTNGLYGLLKRADVVVPCDAKSFREEADGWWRELFNIEQFETENRKFSNEILTDGKGVSIVLKKPKRVNSNKEPCLADFDEVWGLDPGRTDTFVASNEDGDKQRCSTSEFYEDAMYKKSNKKIAGWHERDSAVREAIRNMPTKKTMATDKLELYTKFVLKRLDMLLKFHMRKGFRQLKFKRYRFAQKKLQQLCRRLTSRYGKKTLVGFGDWSNKDSIIKKSPKGPVTRFENQLRRFCTVVPVDEFRTSKLHSTCDHAMENQISMKKVKNKGWRRSRVHSVLHCKHSGCNGMTVNRDVNASLNMLRLVKQHLTDGTRPAAFCRSEVLSRRGLPLGTRKRAASSRGSRSSPALLS